MDIDRSVADGSHREHLVDCAKPDWAAFLNPKLVAKDSPIELAQKGIKHLKSIKSTIVFMSGRNESLRKVTTDWIKKHFNIKVDENTLFLRPLTNRKTPSVYKRVQLKKILKKYKHLVENHAFIAIDDDKYLQSVYCDLGGIALHAPECWAIFCKKSIRLPKEAYWRL